MSNDVIPTQSKSSLTPAEISSFVKEKRRRSEHEKLVRKVAKELFDLKKEMREQGYKLGL